MLHGPMEKTTKTASCDPAYGGLLAVAAVQTQRQLAHGMLLHRVVRACILCIERSGRREACRSVSDGVQRRRLI